MFILFDKKFKESLTELTRSSYRYIAVIMIKSKYISHCTERLAIILIFCYFVFWWMYKLDALPGLHGDEAWFGLKAHQYLTSGVDHVYGMNTYTGILQPCVSALVFKMAGLGVTQLRIAGAIFNLLALFIIYRVLWLSRIKGSEWVFLLFFAQSALYLVAPRVAWEVNTFTLFFIALLAASVVRVISDIKIFRPVWIWLFLLVNLVGSYNHVIFSCLSIAAIIGIGLWSVYNRTSDMMPVIRLLVINLFNLLLLFIVMSYSIDQPVRGSSLAFIFILTVLPILETVGLRIIFAMKFLVKDIPRVSDYVVYGLLSLFMIIFFIFHGLALYQVISNYKVITHAYSYEFSLFSQFVFLATGLVIFYYFFLFLIEDLIKRKESLFAFFIISYLGIFTLYTTRCSFRYYLCIYALMSLYIASKAIRHINQVIPLLVALGATLLIINFSLYQVFNRPDSAVKPVYVRVGNSNQMENSGHFLPNRPLIEFLQTHKIGGIRYLTDRYFLEQPVLFYNLINPREQSPGNIGTVGYDYSGNSRGGYLCKETVAVSN